MLVGAMPLRNSAGWTMDGSPRLLRPPSTTRMDVLGDASLRRAARTQPAVPPGWMSALLIDEIYAGGRPPAMMMSTSSRSFGMVLKRLISAHVLLSC